jgi:hypothetical protein
MTTQTRTRRPRGQVLDAETRLTLAAAVARLTWRCSVRYFLVGEATLRRAIAGTTPIRSATAIAIRGLLRDLPGTDQGQKNAAEAQS